MRAAAGRSRSLGADIGTRVSSGQVLLRLDDPDLRFALNAAELARDRARLELKARHFDAKEAEAAAHRAWTLSAKGALGEQAARDATAAVERTAILAAQAEGHLAEAELAVSRAVQALEELTVRAPIAGIVTARDARLGEAILAQVDARGDAPLFTIIDPSRLALDVDIAETALADVEVGHRGEAVLDAYPDRPFAVTVTRIAPVASAERGTIALRLAFSDAPPGMRPAMAARVTLQTADDLASVPSGHKP
ncbi:efflux RND transporter periplasmic adaptor subunit [Jiella pelagia]|uniref:Efflux RND transporter periplasmic adaptor subunit n=1 Tax=Jiella pelagia TaxID=2986949 RepID=A0ABY7BZK0_9HYPH|nr:efflux RND transporter periplasmic adaptor subunit [Jiella pelagia]WAP68065.1 efflux RND transporter periplasmic adaptor subunit [Jiella pelagia]